MKTTEIRKQIEVFNHLVTAEARDYYFNYLQVDQREKTFDEHLKKYGRLVKTGILSNDSVLTDLVKLTGRELPQELVDFYLHFGSLTDPEYFKIYPASYLVDRIKNPEAFPSWDQLSSGGIIDLIVHRWAGDRRELQPSRSSSALITQDEANDLNRRYQAVGFYTKGDPGLNDAFYIYYDEKGRFGTVYYHQDEPDNLLKDFIRPMLKKSPASLSLSTILITALKAAAADVKEQLEDNN